MAAQSWLRKIIFTDIIEVGPIHTGNLCQQYEMKRQKDGIGTPQKRSQLMRTHPYPNSYQKGQIEKSNLKDNQEKNWLIINAQIPTDSSIIKGK